MQTKTNSPLGGMSIYFREKTRKNGAILDNIEEAAIELYPAGYTKHSERNKANRQVVHEYLFNLAKELNIQDQLFPFDGYQHNICLVPEPSNEHDSNAVRVVLVSHGSRLAGAHEKDLGYIPMKISRQVSKNINLFTEGRILKVRENFHGKYYTTKVILGYGGHKFISAVKQGLERFTALWDE